MKSDADKLNTGKFITIYNFDKFPQAIFDERLKELKLPTSNDLNTVKHKVLSKMCKKYENYQHTI